MTEQKVEVKSIEREIEQEFGKYGFAPFKIEEVAMGNIEESVLQIVADWLYEMVNDVVRYADKATERITEESRRYANRNIGGGINAVLLHKTTFMNDCIMKGKGVNIRIEYYCDDEHGMSGCSDPPEWTKITIIERDEREIFFAKHWWVDIVDLKSVRISTDPKAKNAFQLLQEKHKKI